jgi:hypothetical protein
MHHFCQSHLVEASQDDDPEAFLATVNHIGPCQKVARNYASRLLTTPHDATLGSSSHLRGCVGT